MTVEIIAEAGCNTNGNIRMAFDLVDAAQKAGADKIKFQTWFRSDFTHVPFAPWDKEVWRELFMYCDWRKMPWFSTPFDLEAIAFLKECGMHVWKIPSGMLVNKPYLEAVKAAAGGDRIIVSTGMATLEEIIDVETFFEAKVTFLYCVSLYPALPSEIKLYPAGEPYRFHGISDHSEGIEIPIAAVSHGAKIVEKHLTMDKNLPGPDHKSSLNPLQFAEMVRCIRNVEEALKPKPMSEREYAQRDTIRARMAFR